MSAPTRALASAPDAAKRSTTVVG
ncbi:MAG: hypothetical protein JWM26_4446, partial [Betaproteobacteria bacterium]|nr:hypothetical protein [Betaproteobacteria bacterium]